MVRLRSVRWMAPLVVAVLAGCGGYKRVCVFPAAPEATGDLITIRFLGVGGFLIRRGTDAILTAPLYSNPSLLELALHDFHSDRELVEQHLGDVSDVRAILVGHSHYDHLMDVPHIALRRASVATVYGNEAMLKILAPVAAQFGGRLVAVEDRASTLTRCEPAIPVPGTRVQIRPFLSEHSPQFALDGLLGDVPPARLWRGEPMEPLHHYPTRAGQWPAGTTLSYLIEFLDDSGAVAFRIFYQDSGTRPPIGHPVCGDEVAPSVDLALLTVGGSDTLDDYPASLARQIEPRFVIGAHWEDFFTPRQPKPPPGREPAVRRETIRGIPNSDPKQFEEKLREGLPPDSRYTIPCPDAVVHFARVDGSWEIVYTSEPWRTR